MIRLSIAAAALASCVPVTALAQVADARPPVIDVHWHAPLRPGPVAEFQQDLEEDLADMDRLNVRLAVLNGLPDVLRAWHEAAGDRAIPSLLFPCENGISVNWGRPCFDHGGDWPELERLRADVESGRVQALGEITTQYLGLDPSDPQLEPYLALAEEYDLPVFIHMGPGPPYAAYDENLFVANGGIKAPNYRAAAGNPLLLEEALLRHPGVRVAVMHAGWPMLDEMVFLLYQHPQVYAEVGLLQATSLFTRAEYFSYLKRLVEAGFSDRILFGSDASVEEGIDAILEADFLTESQKRDILCFNAARFLRIDSGICE